MTSVREATLNVARQLGLTVWFGNPGSTEIPLLYDMPDDIEYVLALHENAVIGMAAGYAIATGRPAVASLHTTAGLGNAVSALATSRANRAPLVVLAGQQDRRHLLMEPFLAGRLDGLAGDYPLEVFSPMRAQDVPGCVAQAAHIATAGRGPVLVIVPMDDWDAGMDDTVTAAPLELRCTTGVDPADLAPLAALLADATSPALVTGAGADSQETWDALVDLARRLDCPVFHEPLSARAGYPQDEPRFAGFLPAARGELRAALAPYDVVIVVGAAMLRQYHYEPGPLLRPGTRAAVISADPAEACRSPVDAALIAPVGAAVRALAAAVTPALRAPGRPAPAGQAEQLRRSLLDRARGMTPEALFSELAARIEADTVVVEESPSSRVALQLMLPARRPLGFLSAAMGGLGFGIPAAIGIRMALPQRPVLAIVGDGSSIYCVQALWSAAHYGIGVVIFVMDNARYLVMDQQTARRGKAPWPSLAAVSVDMLAVALGCPAVNIRSRAELVDLLDRVVPGMRARREPLVVNVEIEATE